MRNIYLLPTDKISRLRIGDNGNFVFGLMQSAIVSKNDFFTNHNIYITNDEKGKKGDWVIEFQKGDSIGEVCFIGSEYVIANDIQKKIILTDNEDLIKNGVQPIEDEFLEWFVMNPSCEYVEVNRDWGYPKIIIPKEELKQETLEETAKSKAFEFKVDYKPFEKDLDYGEYAEFGFEKGFIAGAKLKQEQYKNKYSEEEVKEIIKLSCEEGMLIQRTINDKVKIPFMRIKDFTIKMIEQFKKK